MGEIVIALSNFIKEIFFFFFKPFEVVAYYQGAVLLRWGKPVMKRWRISIGKPDDNGVFGPGLIVHLPWNIDKVIPTNIKFETGSASSIQFESTDGHSISCEVIAGYTITNVFKHLLEVEEAEDVMMDMIGGGAYEALSGKTWEELCDPDIGEAVRSAVARRGQKFGVKIETVYMQSLIRLGLKHGAIKVVGNEGG